MKITSIVSSFTSTDISRKHFSSRFLVVAFFFFFLLFFFISPPLPSQFLPSILFLLLLLFLFLFLPFPLCPKVKVPLQGSHHICPEVFPSVYGQQLPESPVVSGCCQELLLTDFSIVCK